MPSRRTALLAAAILAIAAALGAYVLIATGSGRNSPAASATGIAAIGGPFTLTGTDGRTVTEADLRGKPTVIFFGFTFCPDVCPTTLAELSGLIEALGDTADRLNFVFVSVDWERDRPATMASYLSAFDPRIRGLTGTQTEIAQVAKAYRVFYERVPTDNGGYTIDHTASVFLMDAEGRFTGTLAYGEDPAVMLQKLRRLAGA
ncbi:SCO family protein [Marinibaculum pumilum]|uniref:SCO family protein n=1 Tax=Marinibaculum pumilum TaxID=1766165 RepID=A0ABV7L0T8_9PROT